MELYHYGVKHRSGRYPYGSGDRPYQRDQNPLVEKGIQKKKKLAKEILGRSMTRKQAASTTNDQNSVRLNKGDRVQHIGVNFDSLRDGQLYATANDYDNKLYETFLSLNLKSKGYEPKKVTLLLKDDLKAPSPGQQKTLFNVFYGQNKDQIRKDLRQWADKKGKILSSDVYDDFMNSLEVKNESSSKFYDFLKTKGYNAVLDVHDITGSWMQGKAPIIIMDQLASIGSFKIEDLTNEKIMKAFDDYLKLKGVL